MPDISLASMSDRFTALMAQHQALEEHEQFRQDIIRLKIKTERSIAELRSSLHVVKQLQSRARGLRRRVARGSGTIHGCEKRGLDA